MVKRALYRLSLGEEASLLDIVYDVQTTGSRLVSELLLHHLTRVEKLEDESEDVDN